jgi:hypothetical protein
MATLAEKLRLLIEEERHQMPSMPKTVPMPKDFVKGVRANYEELGSYIDRMTPAPASQPIGNLPSPGSQN